MQKNKFDLKHFSNLQVQLIIEIFRLNKLMLDSRGDSKDNIRLGYDELRGGRIYTPRGLI